jgi:hypothetical protein
MQVFSGPDKNCNNKVLVGNKLRKTVNTLKLSIKHGLSMSKTGAFYEL